MFGMGMSELVVVLLIVFLLFGAKRLPEIARALGKAVREFRAPGEENKEEDAAKDPEESGK